MSARGVATDHSTTRPIYQSLLAICKKPMHKEIGSERIELLKRLTVGDSENPEELAQRQIKSPEVQTRTQGIELMHKVTLQAFEELEKLVESGVRVPIAAAMFSSKQLEDGLRASWIPHVQKSAIYLSDGPDIETFHHLLVVCRRLGRWICS